MRTELELSAAARAELAHLPGWFLLFSGGSVHGFPVSPDMEAQEWQCWMGQVLGFWPVALTFQDYGVEQVDARRLIAWPERLGGNMTLFTTGS